MYTYITGYVMSVTAVLCLIALLVLVSAYFRIRNLKLEIERLKPLVFIDELTQVFNRRAFNDFLAREFGRAIREETSIALLILDVDNFKNVNDTFGHPVGDRLLQLLASKLQDVIHRPSDCLFRLDGDEFTIVLPNTSQGAEKIASDLLTCARDIRMETLLDSNSKQLELASTWECSISIGIAVQNPTRDDSLELFIKFADDNLYEAKRAGRNCYYPVNAQ